jgi:hypothetical protein
VAENANVAASEWFVRSLALAATFFLKPLWTSPVYRDPFAIHPCDSFHHAGASALYSVPRIGKGD